MRQILKILNLQVSEILPAYLPVTATGNKYHIFGWVQAVEN